MHCDGNDPALPGDPWSRLRYHYGQLLSADDFQSEQNAMVLRRRLHNALLHGLGTVCGLGVSAEPSDPPQTRLLVGEGLAIDAYGREIYVNETQCLDIIGLHASDVWETLALSPLAMPENPDGDPLSDTRRGYITLCYEACLSNQVPAITPPCGDASKALAFSRVNDRFRIDLVAEAPADSHPLQRDGWPPEARDGQTDPRARLLDFLLDFPGFGLSLRQLWNASENSALLLAVVDLVHEEGTEGELTRVEAIDNSPRAVLPAVRMTAEQLLRQRLAGADTTPSLKLLSIGDNSESADATTLPEYTLRFSAELEVATVNGDSIQVHALEGGGWTAPLAVTVSAAGDQVSVALDAAPAADTRLQLHLIGGGPQPLMGSAGLPLDGWWDEPVSGAGRGKDINVIRVWTPGVV
jgi:hypothetical protein